MAKPMISRLNNSDAAIECANRCGGLSQTGVTDQAKASFLSETGVPASVADARLSDIRYRTERKPGGPQTTIQYCVRETVALNESSN